MKLLLDTNLVVEIGKGSFLQVVYDSFPGAELFVLEASLDEMEYIGGNAAHRARNMVRRLISEGKLLVIDSEGYVDDLLVEYNKDYIVATIDKELLGRLPGKKATLRSGTLQIVA